ncbi:MAG: amidohydrolase family protein [Desulfobacterales bacterium]|nr:amidohydrolase family protein [Desulfobacterales bacterium]
MQDSQVIKAGWLIDGTGAPIRENVLIGIKQEVIDSIAEVSPEMTPEPGITDLSHCTVLPGLVDSHVHLFMTGEDDIDDRNRMLNAGFDTIRDVIISNINDHAAYGIIAVRDGGDRNAYVKKYSELYFCNESCYLDIKVSGKAWFRKGRYGRFIGHSPLPGKTLSESIESENRDTDHIKIINSGVNSLLKFGHETPPQFEAEELQAVVKTAEQMGQKVMVHANGKIPVGMAIDAGCHSIEHGFFMGEENLKKMADAQITWVPTLFAMAACSKQMAENPRAVDVAGRTVDDQMKQLQLAKLLAVNVALGTDSGSIGVNHGVSMIEEMKLMTEAGFSLPDVIKSASQNGASLLDLPSMGSIVPGKSATLVVVKGSPDKLPESLNNIEHVINKGIFKNCERYGTE